MMWSHCIMCGEPDDGRDSCARCDAIEHEAAQEREYAEYMEACQRADYEAYILSQLPRR